jgi:hypothetical protein
VLYPGVAAMLDALSSEDEGVYWGLVTSEYSLGAETYWEEPWEYL